MVVCGCTSHAAVEDAPDADASSDSTMCIYSFSEDESFACFFDGGPYDASTCPSPQGIFSSDAGFPVGCVITENDNPSRIDGACVIPTFSCVATPTTHWEVSWTMY